MKLNANAKVTLRKTFPSDSSPNLFQESVPDRCMLYIFLNVMLLYIYAIKLMLIAKNFYHDVRFVKIERDLLAYNRILK